MEWIESIEFVCLLYVLGAHGGWTQASALLKVGRLEEPHDRRWKPGAMNVVACAVIAVLWPLWELWGVLDKKRRQ